MFSSENANDFILSIYLFGSFVYSETPRDIDLLIIYDDLNDINNTLLVLKTLKEEIYKKNWNTFGLPTHFTTLSQNELSSYSNLTASNFIKLD